MMSFIFHESHEPKELPCPPEKVRELAAQGKDQAQIAAAMGLGLSTLRTKIRNYKSVAKAWREGRIQHAVQMNRRKPPTGKKLSEDQEFEYTVSLRDGDLSVFLAVACGIRRRNKIAGACNLSIDFVVLALDRLEINLLVTKDESGFFDEYRVFITNQQKDVPLNSGCFLLLFLRMMEKYEQN